MVYFDPWQNFITLIFSKVCRKRVKYLACASAQFTLTSGKMASSQLWSLYRSCLSRAVHLPRPSQLAASWLLAPHGNLALTLASRNLPLAPARGYKVRMSLKLMCSGCRFVKRKAKLRVVCSKKPRHKQRQP